MAVISRVFVRPSSTVPSLGHINYLHSKYCHYSNAKDGTVVESELTVIVVLGYLSARFSHIAVG